MRRVGPVSGMTNTGPILAADGTPFVNVNPSANTPGSAVPAQFFNITVDELTHLVEFAGLTPSADDSDLEQVRKAVQAIAALNIPGLTAATSAADNDLLAIALAGGGHRKITVAQLFDGREGVDQVARDMAMVTAFQQFMAGNITAGTFADWARVNVFPTDNLPTKTGATHDATNKVYHNPSTVIVSSAAAEWQGNTAAFTFSGDDVYTGSNGVAIRTIDTFAGDFEVTFKDATGSNIVGYFEMGFGIYPVASDGTFNQASDSGAMNAMAASWWISVDQGARYLMHGGTNLGATPAYGATDVMTIKRVGSTISLLKNGATVYTWAQTSAAEMRLVAAGASTFRVNDLSWTQSGPATDMTLIDAPFSVPSAPLDGRASLLHKFTGAGVLNADIKAFMARDGSGAGGWVQGTLSLQDAFVFNTGFNLLVADFDLSGLPTGTQPLIKVQTFNNVEQQVRAIGAIAS